MDRRNPSLARVPFEALVEIAAPEGTSFEAESVDLSATGMHLKTAYLPRIGTPLTFRFEPGAEGSPILANGQVVWAHDGAEGCEFGVRFGDMKPEGAEAIQPRDTEADHGRADRLEETAPGTGHSSPPNWLPA